MDSAALTAYVNERWPELMAEIGMTTERLVAIVAEVYAANPSLENAWAEPLADYYLFRRAVGAFAPEFKLSTGGDSYDLGSRRDYFEKKLAEAEARVAWIVAPASGEDPLTVMDLNFLTPGPEEGYA